MAVCDQIIDTVACLANHQLSRTELNCPGCTSLLAGRTKPVFQAVVALGALHGVAGLRTDFRYSEGAGCNAHAAAHTNIGLIVNSAEFIPNNRTGRTSLMAWGSAAVFALVAHEQPFTGFRFFEQRINGLWSRTIHGVLFRETFNELHMTPVVGRKIAGVVVAVAGPMVGIGFQLVPLLAGNFARFATSTD